MTSMELVSHHATYLLDGNNNLKKAETDLLGSTFAGTVPAAVSEVDVGEAVRLSTGLKGRK
jgi:hypothetical protein